MYDKSKNRVLKHGAALTVLVIFGLLALGSGQQQASTKSTEPREEIRLEVQYRTTPEIGVETEVTVGNSLIKSEWEETAAVECIAVKANVVNNNDRSAPPPPSGLYIPVFKQGDSTIYQLEGEPRSGYGIAEITETNGNLQIQYEVHTDKMNTTTGFRLNDGDFTRQSFKYDTSSDFNKQLSFTGVSGTVIRFTYREPGLSEPVTYDMADYPEKVIQYLDASFEIVEYSNRSVKYKLLSGFLTPTQGKTMTPIEIVAIAKAKAAK
jgi:hypothetical protein